MPEMRFHIRWPDGRREACYSPSLVIKEHFAVGEEVPLADFVAAASDSIPIATIRFTPQGSSSGENGASPRPTSAWPPGPASTP